MGKHSAVTANGANNHPPQPHAATHKGDGSDPIVGASETIDGLMIAADKKLWNQIAIDGMRRAYLGHPEDFIATSAGAAALSTATSPVFTKPWRVVFAGTGAAVNQTTTGQDQDHWGVLQLLSGTTATGSASISSVTPAVGAITLGTHLYLIQHMLVQMTQLSDGTNTYTARMGLHNATNTAPTDGIYFEYSDGLSSGNWRGVCNSASTPVVASGGTPVAVAGSTWYHLLIVMNLSAGTPIIQFYVNGTLIGSISSPTLPSVAVWSNFQIINSVGTGSGRQLLVDFEQLQPVWSTPRAS